MQGKYTSPIKYNVTRARRAVLKGMIRPLVKWGPLPDPKPGYTILLGANTPLAPLLGLTLKMLDRQRRENLDRVLVMIDRPADQVGIPIERQMRERFPTLPMEFIYYTPMQARVMGMIGWGWTYAWLSWSLGIAATRTKYAFLQDFDAFLLREDLIEERYRTIKERGVEYLGSRYYGGGNGLAPDDGLVGTPELMFDAAYVRANHRPIELFNQVCTYRGRTVDFDTFLYAQSKGGAKAVLPAQEADMVHPSQMICQFTDLMNKSGYVAPEGNSLLLIPYFMFVTGDTALIEEQTRRVEKCDGWLEFYGRRMGLARLRPGHVAWITKQAYVLETTLVGRVRDEARRYFEALEAYVARAGAAAPALAGNSA